VILIHAIVVLGDEEKERGRTMRRVWSSMRPFAAGFLTASIIAATIVAAIIWATRFWAGGLRIDTSRPTVVRQVQQLQRLETVVFRMDKIVSGGYDSRYLPSFFAGDRLLLLVYGDVTAGVDLGGIDVSNVSVSGQAVHLRIPEAEVFIARIDNDRTRVYSRETGLFTRVDPNLESEVRREAERQVRQGALDGGILQAATANARATLTSFLHGLGFKQVEVK
jgi:hypothetical protein